MIEKDAVIEAERALLGAWMMDGLRVGATLQRLKARPSWWRLDRTRRALAEMCMMMTEGRTELDQLTVFDRIGRAEDIDPAIQAGAAEEIEKCMEACPSTAHAEYYASILRREHMAELIRRAFSAMAKRLDNEEPEMIASETAEHMRAVLDENEIASELSVKEVLAAQVTKWRQAAADRAAGKPPEVGVPLPWWRMTKMLGGMPNDLVVLAARPSVGKTTMEGIIRTHAAARGTHVLSMLMDMSEERVLPRDACRDGGVSLAKLAFGYARHDQLDAVEAACRDLAQLPMHFVNKSTRLEVMAMRARHLKAQGKLGLITIDHAQLVTYRGSERHDMRQRVTRVTADTKALAQELGVPVVLLSQLRRCEPGQQEREPELDDLRDSGSLEQDAAIVIMLHKNARQMKTWMKEEESLQPAMREATHDKKRAIDAIIRKSQNGALGRLQFIMRTRYFQMDLADREYRPVRDDDPKADAERE